MFEKNIFEISTRTPNREKQPDLVHLQKKLQKNPKWLILNALHPQPGWSIPFPTTLEPLGSPYPCSLPAPTPHLSHPQFGRYSLNKEDTIGSQDQSSCPTHCHGPAAHHGPLVADLGGGGRHERGGASARCLCGEGEWMGRGAGVPRDASPQGSPAPPPVGTWHCLIPKLPLSLPCHARAELGGWGDEPGDGVVHEAFPTLSLDLLLGEVCTTSQSWTSLSAPSSLAGLLCASGLWEFWLRGHDDMATSAQQRASPAQGMPGP